MLNNSRAFSELLPDTKHTIDDFSIIEDENQSLRREVGLMEQSFAQTDNEFFQASREAMEMESQFSEYQKKADEEIDHLNNIVQSKERELLNIQRKIDQQRGTHASGFSQY